MNAFKNERMAAVYAYCRKHGKESTPDNRVIGGVIREAYLKGRSGIRAMWPRNSMAYAGWAAGRDDRKSTP